MASVAREWTFRLILLTVSMTVALLTAEVAVRIVHPISDGRDNVTLDGVPIESWFAPNMVYRQVANEYNAITTITDKGHRVPGTDGNPDVIFLGDSFTYGWGIDDADTFASIYCAGMKVSCANLGVPGTGTAKQLDRLEQFLQVQGWKPREVKLFFFGMSTAWSAGNDFVDNYDERGLSDARAAGISLPRPSAGRPAAPVSPGIAERMIGLQSAVLQRSNLMRIVKYYWGPWFKSVIVADPGNERMSVALHYTKQNLQRLARLSQQMGFTYRIYLIVPVQDVMLDTYSQTLHTLQSVAPAEVVNTGHLFADNPKRYYYAYDGHINAYGSHKIGEFLVERDR